MAIRKERLALVIILIIITALILGYLAGQRTNPLTNSDKIGVVVSIGPEAEFVKAVGGDKVDVTVMVPSTADVHTYEPLPSQLSSVASSQMYVSVGSGIEFGRLRGHLTLKLIGIANGQVQCSECWASTKYQPVVLYLIFNTRV